ADRDRPQARRWRHRGSSWADGARLRSWRYGTSPSDRHSGAPPGVDRRSARWMTPAEAAGPRQSCGHSLRMHTYTTRRRPKPAAGAGPLVAPVKLPDRARNLPDRKHIAQHIDASAARQLQHLLVHPQDRVAVGAVLLRRNLLLREQRNVDARTALQ